MWKCIQSQLECRSLKALFNDILLSLFYLINHLVTNLFPILFCSRSGREAHLFVFIAEWLGTQTEPLCLGAGKRHYVAFNFHSESYFIIEQKSQHILATIWYLSALNLYHNNPNQAWELICISHTVKLFYIQRNHCRSFDLFRVFPCLHTTWKKVKLHQNCSRNL